MMTQKIGILTFSYSSNPGSVLQAYALQEVVSKHFSCDAHIINYHKEEAGKPIIGKTVFCPPFRNWTPKNIFKWIARIIEYPSRMKPYKKFFNTYYNGYPSKRVYRKDLIDLEPQYDKFIVGSDQVWNFNSCNVDETFFLDFVNDSNKKISYAASMGGYEIPSNKRDELKQLINKFKNISVREDFSVKTILDLTGKKADLVLDPSMLLESSHYLNISKKPKEKKYVLLYLRESSLELETIAKEYAQKNNLSLVKILKHKKFSKKGILGKTISPREWLGYMSNAEYVFTNSFHGICFSIIFCRQFYVYLLKQVSTQTNPRMQSILSMFELEDRMIQHKIENGLDIDYSKINMIKNNMREKSFNYLRNSLEGDACLC